MTLEERLDAHDEYVRLATQVLAENQRRLEAHEQRLEVHERRLEAHDETIRLLTEVLARNERRIEQNEALLEEVNRDSAQTRRLWGRLARRYGWLDDDEPG